MRRGLWIVFVTACALALVLTLMSSSLLAQDVSVPASDVTTVPKGSANVTGVLAILEEVKVLIVGLKGGDLYAVLIALVNILMALIKLPFVQKAFAKLLKRAEGWEMDERTKILIAILFGIALAYFLAPSAKFWRTLARGFLFAFAAMGMYDCYKFFWKKPRQEARERAQALNAA